MLWLQILYCLLMITTISVQEPLGGPGGVQLSLLRRWVACVAGMCWYLPTKPRPWCTLRSGCRSRFLSCGRQHTGHLSLGPAGLRCGVGTLSLHLLLLHCPLPRGQPHITAPREPSKKTPWRAFVGKEQVCGSCTHRRVWYVLNS